MFNRVGKTAHPSIVVMLLHIVRQHEKDSAFPTLVDASVERTFDKTQQWDRVQTDLTNGQTLVLLFADKALTATLDMQDIPASGKRLAPEDVLHAVSRSMAVND